MSEMIVDVFVGIVVGHVVVAGPCYGIDHGSHAAGKLLVSALTHGLQHCNLFFFATAVYYKMVKVHCGHRNPCGFWISGTTTKQADSYSAQATGGGESASVSVHIVSHFQMLDVELRLEFLAS